jgi:hypothetical protein
MKQTKPTMIYRKNPVTPSKKTPTFNENPVRSNKKSTPPNKRTKHRHPVLVAVHDTSGTADIKFL